MAQGQRRIACLAKAASTEPCPGLDWTPASGLESEPEPEYPEHCLTRGDSLGNTCMHYAAANHALCGVVLLTTLFDAAVRLQGASAARKLVRQRNVAGEDLGTINTVRALHG